MMKDRKLLKQLISALPEDSEVNAVFENFPIRSNGKKQALVGRAKIKMVGLNHKKKSKCKIKLTKNDRTLLELDVNSDERELIIKRANIPWLLSQFSLIRALLHMRTLMRESKLPPYRIRISKEIFTSIFSSRTSKKYNQQKE